MRREPMSEAVNCHRENSSYSAGEWDALLAQENLWDVCTRCGRKHEAHQIPGASPCCQATMELRSR